MQSSRRPSIQEDARKYGIGKLALAGVAADHQAVELTEMAAKKVAKAFAMRLERLEVMTGGAAMRMPPATKPLIRMIVLGFDVTGEVIYVEDIWGKSALRPTINPASPQHDDKYLVIRIYKEMSEENLRPVMTMPAISTGRRRLRGKSQPQDLMMDHPLTGDQPEEPQEGAEPDLVDPFLPDGRRRHDGFGPKPEGITEIPVAVAEAVAHSLGAPGEHNLGEDA